MHGHHDFDELAATPSGSIDGATASGITSLLARRRPRNGRVNGNGDIVRVALRECLGSSTNQGAACGPQRDSRTERHAAANDVRLCRACSHAAVEQLGSTNHLLAAASCERPHRIAKGGRSTRHCRWGQQQQLAATHKGAVVCRRRTKPLGQAFGRLDEQELPIAVLDCGRQRRKRLGEPKNRTRDGPRVLRGASGDARRAAKHCAATRLAALARERFQHERLIRPHVSLGRGEARRQTRHGGLSQHCHRHSIVCRHVVRVHAHAHHVALLGGRSATAQRALQQVVVAFAAAARRAAGGRGVPHIARARERARGRGRGAGAPLPPLTSLARTLTPAPRGQRCRWGRRRPRRGPARSRRTRGSRSPRRARTARR
mmetsp:Transcript_6464/g.26293  ORF Transcript_6464/g.26293 Transcript_6464/m.26293 type:complete len:373 (-) Transcript_6464:552-1670(-)